MSLAGHALFVAAVLYGWMKFYGWSYTHGKLWVYSLTAAISNTVFFLLRAFVFRDQVEAALWAGLSSYWWYRFWKQKPPFDRKKADRLVGAKARALKQKLVDSMPKALPVMKPAFVPAGV